jgi:autotransporter-associated beta strand protein
MAGLCILLALSLMGAPAMAQVKAFPGAEGFGADATGGRGGHVYHVTSLADTNTQGTLRHAMSNNSPAGPRTVVFDVGGYINLTSKLGAVRSDLTIAGQTAPGGIGVRGDQTSLGADNLIIRHLRFRPGKGAGRVDALNVNPNADNTIVDHCSIQFSYDENGPIDSPEDVTVQWSINAWGLEDHSAGSLLNAKDTTVHHTLWAHNHTRNPKARGGLLDWVNNVTFDWDIPYILADTANLTHWSNVVGCYFISGASGQNRAFTSGQTNSSGVPTYSMYLSDTLTDFSTNGVLDGTDKGYGVVSGSVNKPPRYDAPAVTTDDPLTAYKKVLSKVGAWPRDQVDALVINDVKTFRRRIIARESDLGLPNAGFGVIGGGQFVPDTDLDGMSDAWETALGLQVNAADNNGDQNGNGYTNLEDYLNWLAEPHATTQVNKGIDINLQTYAAGFDSDATYAFANVVGGTVALQADGHTARFTPTTDYEGVGGFDFTVNDGQTMTQRFGVLVTSLPGPPSLTWLGDGLSNVWNVAGDVNWHDGEAAAAFEPGADVTFDDDGSASPMIQLSGTLQPAAVVVEANQNYTFGGTGNIGGGATLTKSGAGTLRIETQNGYSGGTTIYEGMVVMVEPTSLSVGPVTISGGTLVMGGESDLTADIAVSGAARIVGEGNNILIGRLSGEGELEIDIERLFSFDRPITDFSGTIRIVSDGLLRFNEGTSTWGSDGILFDAGDAGIISNRLVDVSGTIRLGGLAGAPGSTLQATEKGDATPGLQNTYSIGGLNTDSTFDGTIQDTVHVLAIAKIGTGTLTLGGDSAFTGGMLIGEGGVQVNGSTLAGNVTVQNGARLGCDGTIGTNVIVHNGGIVEPGASVGTMTCSGNLTLADGAVLDMEVGASADRIHTTGNLRLGGVLNVLPAGGFHSGTYPIFTYAGQLTMGNLQLGSVPVYAQAQIDMATPGTVNLVLTVNETGATCGRQYR